MITKSCQKNKFRREMVNNKCRLRCFTVFWKAMEVYKKIFMILMANLAEEGSTSRTDVIRVDRDRPSIWQPDATRFARSYLSQFPFEPQGRIIWPSMRASLIFRVAHPNQIYTKRPCQILFHSPPSRPPGSGEEIARVDDGPDAQMQMRTDEKCESITM